MVAASRCHLEGAACLLLPMNLDEVVLSRFDVAVHNWFGWRLGLDPSFLRNVRHHSGEVGARNHLKPLDEGSLRSVHSGNEDALEAVYPHPPGGDEHAVDVADAAIQRKLSEERGAGRRRLAHHSESCSDRYR